MLFKVGLKVTTSLVSMGSRGSSPWKMGANLEAAKPSQQNAIRHRAAKAHVVPRTRMAVLRFIQQVFNTALICSLR